MVVFYNYSAFRKCIGWWGFLSKRQRKSAISKHCQSTYHDTLSKEKITLMNFPTLSSVNVLTLWTRSAVRNGLSRSFIWVNVSSWGTFFAQQISKFGATSWVTHYVLVKPSYGLNRLPGLYQHHIHLIKITFTIWLIKRINFSLRCGWFKLLFLLSEMFTVSFI